MENNCILMAALSGHAVVYTIGTIFKHIIDCMQLYFTNGFMNIVFWSVNCLWLVGVTLIFNGSPQTIVQRCQIVAPKWPNDISFAADNAIFKNRAQNIEFNFGCVARRAALLKPNVANIPLFNFCEQKFVLHDPITKKTGPIMPLDQNPHQTVTRFGCVGFSMYSFGFSVPQMRQFCMFTKPSRSKWAYLKSWFFCQNRHLL